MNTMTDFRGRIGNVLRVQTFVDRFPGFAAIIRPERARRGNRDEHSLLILWIDQESCADTFRLRPAATLGRCRVCGARTTPSMLCRHLWIQKERRLLPRVNVIGISRATAPNARRV